MVKFHFKKGSIVVFGFRGQKSMYETGKVIGITDTDVVILEQEYVATREYEDDGVSGMDFDPQVTVDVGGPVYLNRALITGWKYSPVYCDPKIKNYSRALTPSEVKGIDRNRINIYRDGGYCKGEGAYLE